MATQVLLMTDVPNVGAEGDVVNVADGFARNYLLPRKLAAPVTEATRRQLAKQRVARETLRQAELAAARAQAEKLGNAEVTMRVKVGEGNRLYGSVTTAEIATALQKQGIEVDRHKLVLEQPIKELGVFEVKLRLHAEVEATVKVWVVEE